MKKLFLAAAFFVACLASAAPQKVIFDTDIGNDVDDALALAMLYDYEASGRAQVLAVLLNNRHPASIAFTSVMNNYYGFGKFPVGVSADGISSKDGRYAVIVSDMKKPDGSFAYPRSFDAQNRPVDAVKLARKVLSESEDGSVIYISVGFSTNVVNLLSSQADEYSKLDGIALVAKKVKYFSVMAGQFATYPDIPRLRNMMPEYNIRFDPPAARAFFGKSPVPIVFSGFEIGEIVRFPKEAVLEKLSAENPLAVAYKKYAVSRKTGELYDTCAFDLTSVLYVFSPELFEISEAGNVVVDEKNISVFTPSKGGLHKYLILPKDGAKKISEELAARVATLKPQAEK